LLIVATVVAEELQLTDVVRFCVLPSLYVPVAVNCRVVPATIEGLVGVTASEVSVEAGVMVTEAVVLPPRVAVKVTVWGVATDAAVAANVVDGELAGTVAELGTGSAVALSDASVTMLPPAGAA
jgi:hypothetical protein